MRMVFSCPKCSRKIKVPEWESKPEVNCECGAKLQVNVDRYDPYYDALLASQPRYFLKERVDD